MRNVGLAIGSPDIVGAEGFADPVIRLLDQTLAPPRSGPTRKVLPHNLGYPVPIGVAI